MSSVGLPRSRTFSVRSLVGLPASSSGSVFAASLAVVLALILPSAASAKDIHVHPGDGLQRVVNRASPGDVLRIHGGHYNPTGGLTVNKRLTLVGYNARPRIRGNCGTTFTIRVRHNKVVLNHLKVVGANHAEVDYRHLERGKAKDLKLEPKCEGVEYGVNVFDTGALEVVGNIVWGYEDAGIYVGQIVDDLPGEVVVDGNESFGNNRGVIIENSNGDILIEVTNNSVHDNTLAGVGSTMDGVYVTNSDGVLIANNDAADNASYGFHLVSGSEDVVLNDNTASGNGSGPFLADGTSTACGTGNSSDNFGLSGCP